MTVGNEHDDEVISHNIELPFVWSTYYPGQCRAIASVGECYKNS